MVVARSREAEIAERNFKKPKTFFSDKTVPRSRRMLFMFYCNYNYNYILST
jgi:hypothetical protein